MKAVVVGGGVAGTASAIALARVGATVEMYEAYEDPAGPVGSFVSLAANGLRALAVLGCLEQVQQAGFPVPRQRMWAGHGKALGDVARGRNADDPLHSVTLMRADLIAVLRAQAERAGVRIRAGERLEPTIDGAGPAAAADLIVGADGIWSATRRVLDPAGPEPTYGDLYSVSGVSDGSAVVGARAAPRLDAGSFNMILGRRGAFLYLPAPDGSIWWSAQVSSPRPPGPNGARLEDLIENFRAEPWAVAILRSVRTIHGTTPHHVLAPVRRLHDNRIALIGDAAHPVGAGQGASMAIEDAVVLAQQLPGAGSVAAALASYERLRRARLDGLARMATANRDAKTAGPIAARVRNVVMPLVFSRFYGKGTGWLYAFDPGVLPAVPAVPAVRRADTEG